MYGVMPLFAVLRVLIFPTLTTENQTVVPQQVWIGRLKYLAFVTFWAAVHYSKTFTY